MCLDRFFDIVDRGRANVLPGGLMRFVLWSAPLCSPNSHLLFFYLFTFAKLDIQKPILTQPT